MSTDPHASQSEMPEKIRRELEAELDACDVVLDDGEATPDDDLPVPT